MKSSQGLSQTALLFLMISMAVFSGCAKNKNLQRTSEQQTATIESLNKEIGRLNQELQAAMKSKENLEKAKAELENKLKEELSAGDMSISLQDRGLVVTVLDRVLFDSGKADLKSSSKNALDKLAAILEEKVKDHMIYVEGHTDNVPIRISGWRSNWELSSARATEVIHYFVEQKGFRPERLAAVGYGEFHPVTSNRSVQGRLMNRRVEIVISPKKFQTAALSVAS
jgi:chemotaxis protein MotB